MAITGKMIEEVRLVSEGVREEEAEKAMAHKYTIEQYSERLRQLANAQDQIVAEEARTAGILAGDDNFDAAAEHVQLAVEAKAQAEAYKHAHLLLAQMGLVE